MRLYILHRCPFGHRAAFALTEKQIPYDTVFFERTRRPPELEAIGPRAKSPTLVNGATAVHDSGVVLEYIEEAIPARPLLPSRPGERAVVRMAIARINDELMPVFGGMIQQAIFTNPRDEAKLADARRAFLEALAPWDRALEGRTYLAGDAFSLADITLYTIFPAAQNAAGVEIPAERPHLRAWLDRTAARPAAALPTPS